VLALQSAIADLRKAVEMEPNYFASHFHLGLALLHSRKKDEALAELEKAVNLSARASPVALAALGYARAASGNPREARRILAELDQLGKKRIVSPVYRAAIYTGLGEKKTALDWLEKGLVERSQPLNHVSLEPSFDPLRPEPRYQELMRRIREPR
jgi:tetratricopeptide (TPR) repeat protein